eukprot:704155-Rhodomonas_salina.1
MSSIGRSYVNTGHSIAKCWRVRRLRGTRSGTPSPEEEEEEARERGSGRRRRRRRHVREDPGGEGG